MRVGIIGVNGYTGQGILWALSGRTDVEVTLATSRGEAGKALSEAVPAYAGVAPYQRLVLTHPDSLEEAARKDPPRFPELFFLCVSHGASLALAPRILSLGAKVIDLTGDFRLKDASLYPKFYKMEHSRPDLLNEAVYGLPELHREEIRKARLIANPGCYPTSMILALAPLASRSLIDPAFPVVCDSKSGVSGAGKRSEAFYGFSELNDNFLAYKMVGHQHTPEARQELEGLMKAPLRLSFTPHLSPMSRGIFTTAYAKLKDGTDFSQVLERYREFYKDEPFVRLRNDGGMVSVLDVRGTNFCDIQAVFDPEAGLVKIVSAIDNLARGAVTQAVANFNLMTGLPETLGIPCAPLRP